MRIVQNHITQQTDLIFVGLLSFRRLRHNEQVRLSRMQCQINYCAGFTMGGGPAARGPRPTANSLPPYFGV